MPTIKVSEFAYGRLQSPDLDRAEAFLTEFGMRRAARTKTALYMRGSDAAHHIHATDLGEPRFLSLAFAVADPDDLRRVATLAGASGIELAAGCRDRPSLPSLHAGEECRAQAVVRILTLVLVSRSGWPEHVPPDWDQSGGRPCGLR